MPDDKKKKDTGIGDRVKGSGATDTVTLTNELVADKLGLQTEDINTYEEIKKALDKEGGPSFGTGINGLAMTDYGAPDTPLEHQEFANNIAGGRAPEGTLNSAVWGIKKDEGPIQDPNTFDYEGKLVAFEKGSDAALDNMRNRPEWAKAEREMDWGRGIMGVGAAVGVPALALIGMLLGGKGRRAQNQMMGSYTRGMREILDDDKKTTAESLAQQRAIDTSMLMVQTAVQNGGDVDAVVAAETARLKAAYPDITNDVLTTTFASARAGGGQSPTDTVGKKGAEDVLERAKVTVETQLTTFREEGGIGDAEDAAYKGNFEKAGNELYNKLEGTAASGYDAKGALNTVFDLEQPGDFSEIAEIKAIKGKHLHRSAPVDDILKAAMGKEELTADDAKIMGYISAADVEKVPALKDVTPSAPLVVQASEYLWWMLDRKSWKKVTGGYMASAPTNISKKDTGGIFPSSTYGRIPTPGKGFSDYLPLSDRVFSERSNMLLYAELSTAGLSNAMKEDMSVKMEVLR